VINKVSLSCITIYSKSVKLYKKWTAKRNNNTQFDLQKICKMNEKIGHFQTQLLGIRLVSATVSMLILSSAELTEFSFVPPSLYMKHNTKNPDVDKSCNTNNNNRLPQKKIKKYLKLNHTYYYTY